MPRPFFVELDYCNSEDAVDGHCAADDVLLQLGRVRLRFGGNLAVEIVERSNINATIFQGVGHIAALEVAIVASLMLLKTATSTLLRTLVRITSLYSGAVTIPVSIHTDDHAVAGLFAVGGRAQGQQVQQRAG